MSQPMLRTVLVLAYLMVASGTHGDEPVTKEKVDALVEQLASPNEKPTIRGATAKYPPGYDRKAQGRVVHAFFELRKLGPSAFPHLVEHVNDNRYSMTQDGGAAMSNWSIGDACYDVMWCQLQPYGTFTEGDGDARERPRRPWYPGHIKLHDPKALNVWYAARKDKSLRELQIEGLEWVVAEEEKAPDKYSAEERAAVRKLLEDLKASVKPLKPAVPWAR